MYTYNIWWRIKGDNRSPEYALLNTDYVYAGEVEGISPRDVANNVDTMDPSLSQLQDHRRLAIGDVIQDQHGPSFILTTNGVWAEVEIVANGAEVLDTESDLY